MEISQVIVALESVFGPFGHDSALDVEQLRSCEARLGLTLPDALRTMYLRTGAHPLHRACDFLVPLEELHFEGELLVFYEQAQQSVRWAVELAELSKSDPRVLAVYDDEVVEDSSHVSAFLCFEAAWQSINGSALPYYGLLEEYLEGTQLASLTFEAEGTLLATTRHGAIRYEPGAIMLHRAEAGGFFGLAASSEARFTDIAKRLGVSDHDWTIRWGQD